MNEAIIVFLVLSLLYGIKLYISIGSQVYLADIVLASFLAPSVLWLKIYGTVLSFCGIKAYYMIAFDEIKPDSGV